MESKKILFLSSIGRTPALLDSCLWPNTTSLKHAVNPGMGGREQVVNSEIADHHPVAWGALGPVQCHS